MFTLRYIPNEDHQIKELQDIPEHLPHRINMTLSSGIDSHYILHTFSLMPNFRASNYEALCVDFIDTRDGDEPESVKAKQIAEKYGVDFVKVTIDDPLEDLAELISIVKEPRWNLYQYYLYLLAKERTGVLITGDGADELYLGYTFRYQKYLDSVFKCKTWEDKAKLYLQCHANDWVKDQEQLFYQNRHTTPPFNWNLIINHLKQYFYDGFFTESADKIGDKNLMLGPVILADINGKLRYDYIPSNTKLAKKAGIELLTPFLTPHEFENSLKNYSITEKYNYEKNIGKIPLRHLLNRMTDNHKRGFGFDLVKYWQRKGFDRIAKKINKDSLCFEYINIDWWNKHLSDISVPYINKFLQIYSLELYLELIDKEQIVEELIGKQ